MSIKQRLYPVPGHMPVLVEHCHHARFVYNIGLEQRSMWRKDKHLRAGLSAPRVTVASQMRELAILRQELDWLRIGSSSIQQAGLRDLDKAFSNFFAGRASYPKFKKRSDQEGSFYLRDLKVRRLNGKWGEVQIPKLGYVRFRITRPWHQIKDASSARITHKNRQWHISFTTPPPERISAGTGAVTGIDRGVANSIALADGTMMQAPSLTPGEQQRFLALQRKLSRQVKGSKNRAKTLNAMAVLRRRLDSRRRDWVEQTTTQLARTFDVIAVEDLRIKNMVRKPKPQPDPENQRVFLPNRARAKAGLNRAILASCWGAFATRLEAKLLPGHLLKVDPKNTSRTCAQCGYCASLNRESQAVFVCQSCHYQAHADTNASVNILRRGMKQYVEPKDFGGSPDTKHHVLEIVHGVWQEPASSREAGRTLSSV